MLWFEKAQARQFRIECADFNSIPLWIATFRIASAILWWLERNVRYACKVSIHHFGMNKNAESQCEMVYIVQRIQNDSSPFRFSFVITSIYLSMRCCLRIEANELWIIYIYIHRLSLLDDDDYIRCITIFNECLHICETSLTWSDILNEPSLCTRVIRKKIKYRTHESIYLICWMMVVIWIGMLTPQFICMFIFPANRYVRSIDDDDNNKAKIFINAATRN